MATIDIGKLTFTHKGDYSGSTAYVLNDVVYYNGSAYIAKTSTTGNLPTSTAHWNQFSAGSGGIWNSGLSLGTAGQVVKVNLVHRFRIWCRGWFSSIFAEQIKSINTTQNYR